MTIRQREWAIGIGVAVAIGVLAFAVAVTLDQRFLDQAVGNDVWFEGDLARVADDMTHRWAPHSRATVHPLFSLITVAIAYAVRATGASFHVTVAAVVAIGAVAWALAAYALFRALSHSASDATVLVGLCAASAAGQFWLAVPESAAFGSASVLAALAVSVYAARRAVRETWWVIAAAGSLAITVTNFAAAVIGAVCVLPWRRAIQVLANAVVVVVALWCVQRLVVPRADFFVGYSNEERYLLRPEAGGPINALRVVVVHGMVMPTLKTWVKPARGTIMTVQRSGFADMPSLGRVALLLWLLMLVAGVVAHVREWPLDRGRLALMVLLTFELFLFAVYGTETFLYTLNVVPLLVAIAAQTLRTRWRRMALPVLVALIVLAGVNNAQRLRDARSFYDRPPQMLEFVR